jgi:hypothetical protein
MTTMEGFSEAYSRVYAAKRTKTRSEPRKPLLASLGVILAVVVATVVGWAGRFRRNILYLTGFGFLDFAAWGVHYLLGCAAIGVTLFLLDFLASGGEDE